MREPSHNPYTAEFHNCPQGASHVQCPPQFLHVDNAEVLEGVSMLPPSPGAEWRAC